MRKIGSRGRCALFDSGSKPGDRHCDERSDEAIQGSRAAAMALGRRVALARSSR